MTARAEAIDLIRKLGRSPKFADLEYTGKMNTLANALIHLGADARREMATCGMCSLCEELGGNSDGSCIMNPRAVCTRDVRENLEARATERAQAKHTEIRKKDLI